MRKPIEIKQGDKYARLTIVEEIEPFYNSNNKMVRIFKCQCECGNIKNVRLLLLRNGEVKSCGCLHRENSKNRTIERNSKHNDSKRYDVKSEYNSWAGMKQRCYYEKHIGFKHYGARGIKVCDRWLDSYENFLIDMGRKPGPEYSIDRINVNGNYEPSNCRWATNKEQIKNQRRWIEKYQD
jgi:hypothetical protein